MVQRPVRWEPLAKTIFISYRRHASASAGRLYDAMIYRLGEESVFLDVDGIAPGADFARTLRQTLGTCRVLVVVIDPLWLSEPSRLDDPNDWVRQEIEFALTRRLDIFPVLVDGAAMPRREALPASIAALAGHQSAEITATRYRYDVTRLLDAVQRSAGLAPPVPGWTAERTDRSAQEAVFRLRCGTRQHVVSVLRGGLSSDRVMVDGVTVHTEQEMKVATVVVDGEGGPVSVRIRLVKAAVTSAAESLISGLTFGLVRRLGRVQIAVDGKVIYEG